MIRIFCDICDREMHVAHSSKYSLSLPRAKEREYGGMQPLEQIKYDHVCERCYIDIADKLGNIKHSESLTK